MSARQRIQELLDAISAVGVKRLIDEGKLSVERVVHIVASDIAKVGYKIDYKGEHEIHIDTENEKIIVDGDAIRDYDLVDEVNEFFDSLFGEPFVHTRFGAERSRHLSLA